MRYGNIWDMPDDTPQKNAICVTTNGIIKKNGEAVMGRGIAKDANDRFHVAGILADHLRRKGNCLGVLGYFETRGHAFYLLSFPTKHDWRNPSDIHLIQKSAKELVRFTDKHQLSHVYLTPPGCGNGRLEWTDVKTVLEPLFDNRFIIVEK